MKQSAPSKVTYWDLKKYLLQKIAAHGGWVNAHAHFDRAFTITKDSLSLSQAHLTDKWSLVDEMKLHSSVSQIYDRMAQATELMISQGVTAVGSFIDIDEIIKDKAIKAAQKLKSRYSKDITIKFINQTLKGVIQPEARKWFDLGSQFVDIIGGLPYKDAGREAQHLDILFDTAKKQHKLVHVHVDQLNTAAETETELLTKKTIEHGLQNQVVAIHCISVAAHTKRYRQELYQKMKRAGIMVVACPTAWIDSVRSEATSPTHNSVTPVDELVPAGITVALGTDNIADIYKPFTDGDMWTELRFLLEACRFYDLDSLVQIATVYGKKVLGIT